MKHTWNITLLLVAMFFVAQVIGLGIIKEYTSVEKYVDETGETRVNITETALPLNIERPPVSGYTIVTYVVIAILIGTVLIFLLMKFRMKFLWKIWFLLATVLLLTIAFKPFLDRIFFGFGQSAAILLALVLGLWKVLKPNAWVQITTELFVYGGLAAILVTPKIMPSVYVPAALLIIISLYDIYAVWRSGHMIKLANFQKESKIFAGLLVPYRKQKGMKVPKAGAPMRKVTKTAVLGGGDIGFPLIFAGVVLQQLLLETAVWSAFLKTLIIPIAASASLFLLLVRAKQDRFYPAMPFITIGCFVGYAIVALI